VVGFVLVPVLRWVVALGRAWLTAPGDGRGA